MHSRSVERVAFSNVGVLVPQVRFWVYYFEWETVGFLKMKWREKNEDLGKKNSDIVFVVRVIYDDA